MCNYFNLKVKKEINIFNIKLANLNISDFLEFINSSIAFNNQIKFTYATVANLNVIYHNQVNKSF